MFRTNSQKGFTLIELVVTLTILTLLTTLAVPSFRGYLSNQLVKSLSYELMASLRYARSEAVKRNATVSVVANDAGWGAGWSIQDSGGNVIRSRSANASAWSIVEASSQTSIGFKGNGRCSNAASFSVCDSDSSATISKRLLTVTTSGVPLIKVSGNCGGG